VSSSSSSSSSDSSSSEISSGALWIYKQQYQYGGFRYSLRGTDTHGPDDIIPQLPGLYPYPITDTDQPAIRYEEDTDDVPTDESAIRYQRGISAVPAIENPVRYNMLKGS